MSGFPGAGKTWALAAAARHFQGQGRRLAVITNDLGTELVDTVVLRSEGWKVEEIAGGNFAGRLQPLLQLSRRLEKTASDIILAEPAGSSADLHATVIEPLRRALGDAAVFAPLTVVVEPHRAERFLGLAPGRPEETLSEPLRDLYRQQLAEADLIVVARADRLSADARQRLQAGLASAFPQAGVLALVDADERNVAAWCARLEEPVPRPPKPIEIDYARYAQAVAHLAWLDATIEFTLAEAVPGATLLPALGRCLQRALASPTAADPARADAPIDLVQLKIALRDGGSDDLGLLYVTREDEPVMARRPECSIETGELMVNLRAEATPERLHTALRAAIVELARAFPGLQTEFAHLHYFRPAKPVPSDGTDF